MKKIEKNLLNLQTKTMFFSSQVAPNHEKPMKKKPFELTNGNGINCFLKWLGTMKKKKKKSFQLAKVLGNATNALPRTICQI